MLSGDLRVLVAGEDQVHRALGRWFVRFVIGEAGRASFVGIDGDGYKHAGATARLRVELGLPPGRPLFRDNVAHLRGFPTAAKLADLVRLTDALAPGAVLVVLRDSDGDEEIHREIGALYQWYRAAPRRVPALAVGAPHQDAESWFVAGLANDPALQRRRCAAKQRLKFDPCEEPERLTHAPNDADRDAKRVLAFLLGDAAKLSEVESAPQHPATLDELCDRAFSGVAGTLASPAGIGTGMANFVDALHAALGSPPR